MAQSINYLIAQCVKLSTSLDLTVYDEADPGGRTVTVNASGTRYFRHLLGSLSGSGNTAATALDFEDYLTDLLNAGTGETNWLVAMNASGFIVTTYSGDGTGQIDWDVDLKVPSFLGYAGSSIGPLSTGQSSTATYHPTHCVFGIARGKASDWVGRASRAYVRETTGGKVYGFGSGSPAKTLAFDSDFHPRNWTVRGTLSAAGTPLMRAGAWTRATLAFGTAAPWSVEDAVQHAVESSAFAQYAAFAMGDDWPLATLISGGSLIYGTGALAPATLRAEAISRLRTENWSAYHTWPVRLNWYADGARV